MDNTLILLYTLVLPIISFRLRLDIQSGLRIPINVALLKSWTLANCILLIINPSIAFQPASFLKAIGHWSVSNVIIDLSYKQLITQLLIQATNYDLV